MFSTVETDSRIDGKVVGYRANDLYSSTGTLEVGLFSLGPKAKFTDHKVTEIHKNNLPFFFFLLV